MDMSQTIKLNQAAIINQFPILKGKMNNKPLVYLDNTATTQKPQSVIDSMTTFYTQEYATVHRGVYGLSQAATERCDAVRVAIQRFINAASEKEIIFTKGTTESINLVANSYGLSFIKPGEEILVSQMEHHANIVPWQVCAERVGAKIKVIPMSKAGELDLVAFENLLSEKTALVAVTHTSNVLGTVNDVKTITQKAHQVGAKVLVDGAQSIAHSVVDVQDIDCDFFCFSAHKMYGPTGIGVLYGKECILDKMPPFLTGGDMIETVSFEKTTYTGLPLKFEAGTPPIVETIGLGAAVAFLENIGLSTIAQIEDQLLAEATHQLSKIEGLTIVGTAKQKASIISFTLDNIHPHDAGSILDDEGVAVRVGHHCAQPIMQYYQIPATIRASFSMYNTSQDIQALGKGLAKVQEVML